MIEFREGIFSTAFEEHQDNPAIAERLKRLIIIAKQINTFNFTLFVNKSKKIAMLVQNNVVDILKPEDMSEVDNFDDFCIAMTQSTITNINVGTYKMVENLVEYLNNLMKTAQQDGKGNMMVMPKQFVRFDNN